MIWNLRLQYIIEGKSGGSGKFPTLQFYGTSKFQTWHIYNSMLMVSGGLCCCCLSCNQNVCSFSAVASQPHYSSSFSLYLYFLFLLLSLKVHSSSLSLFVSSSFFIFILQITRVSNTGSLKSKYYQFELHLHLSHPRLSYLFLLHPVLKEITTSF